MNGCVHFVRVHWAEHIWFVLPLSVSYMYRMCITTKTTKENREGIKKKWHMEGSNILPKKAKFLFLLVYFMNKRIQGNAVFDNRWAATRDVATRSTCLACARLQWFDLQHCKNNKYINKWLHIGNIIFLGLTCKMGSKQLEEKYTAFLLPIPHSFVFLVLLHWLFLLSDFFSQGSAIFFLSTSQTSTSSLKKKSLD